MVFLDWEHLWDSFQLECTSWSQKRLWENLGDADLWYMFSGWYATFRQFQAAGFLSIQLKVCLLVWSLFNHLKKLFTHLFNKGSDILECRGGLIVCVLIHKGQKLMQVVSLEIQSSARAVQLTARLARPICFKEIEDVTKWIDEIGQVCFAKMLLWLLAIP